MKLCLILHVSSIHWILTTLPCIYCLADRLFHSLITDKRKEQYGSELLWGTCRLPFNKAPPSPPFFTHLIRILDINLTAFFYIEWTTTSQCIYWVPISELEEVGDEQINIAILISLNIIMMPACIILWDVDLPLF